LTTVGANGDNCKFAEIGLSTDYATLWTIILSSCFAHSHVYKDNLNIFLQFLKMMPKSIFHFCKACYSWLSHIFFRFSSKLFSIFSHLTIFVLANLFNRKKTHQSWHEYSFCLPDWKHMVVTVFSDRIQTIYIM
jgi:hypothetical protein